MRWYTEQQYPNDFYEHLDKENYPLTADMCSKNRYELLSWMIIVRIFHDQEIPYPTAIVIYREIDLKKIHIFSLEVHKNLRLNNNGRKLLDKFKEDYDEITLSTLPESKLFYVKLGFIEQEENQMIWRKPNGKTST